MNCKPGDIAVICGATSHPDANGRFVNVLTLSEDYQEAWRVDFCGPLPTSVISRFQGRQGKLVVADRLLKPIRGLPQASGTATETDRPIEELA